MKFKHIIYSILPIISIWSHTSYARTSDLVTVTANSSTCSMNRSNDFSVCILNKTGQTLHSDEFNLGLSASSPGGSYSSDENISYGALDNDHYIIVESTISRIKEGDVINGLPYDVVWHTLRTQWGQIFTGCEFKWDVAAPPYNSPPTLLIEKVNDKIQCHFVRS